MTSQKKTMTPASDVPYHQIRASFTESTIIVYQAYNSTIADAAIRAQTLAVPEFKVERMTWIKPSFKWMLYRCGWAQKANQERVLALHLTREGWEQALKWSGSKEEGACVRIQWDPERDLKFNPLGWRSIQVGLSGKAVSEGLLGGWIVKVEDVTELAKEIGRLVASNNLKEAGSVLPDENPYDFLHETTRVACGAD
jgi:Domain of unknown function (DUF4291)